MLQKVSDQVKPLVCWRLVEVRKNGDRCGGGAAAVGVREATGCVVLTDIIAVATSGPPSCPALTPAARPTPPSPDTASTRHLAPG